jgi:hypothetical protein
LRPCDGDEAGDDPAELIATTVKVYVDVATSPETLQRRSVLPWAATATEQVLVADADAEVTRYWVIADVPAAVGADHVTTMDFFVAPFAAWTLVGAEGGVGIVVDAPVSAGPKTNDPPML